LRLQSQLKTHGSETYKNADVFIRDLLEMINKFAALLLIGMAGAIPAIPLPAPLNAARQSGEPIKFPNGGQMVGGAF